MSAPASGDSSAPAVNPHRASLQRSRSWAVSPGMSCPGTLELTASSLEFHPDTARWIAGGIGGRRALCIPLAAIQGVGYSPRFQGLMRGWPGKVLDIRLASGRRVMFGVPRIADWVAVLRQYEGGTRIDADLDRQLRAVTRDLLLDIAVTAVGLGAVITAMSMIGDRAMLFGAGALLAARWVVRIVVCR